ncbi:MAG: carbon-nitrogen hydrolase family protein [Phycisphaerales bacterium]|nr:carbon-nitrogen hydrolase family protein [Phycisphaerales bacterium]
MASLSRRGFLKGATTVSALNLSTHAALHAGQSCIGGDEKTCASKNTDTHGTDPLLVALLQMNADGSNQAANLEHGLAFCRRAAAMGADIALFPEMWNIGYGWLDSTDPEAVRAWQAQAVARDGEFIQRHMALAKELNMAIAVTYLEQWPGAPRNTMTLIDRHGQQKLTYAKVHTCDFAIMEAATTPGDDFPVCELDTAKGPVKVGAMICYDREFPESARILMLKGAELILTPNACRLEDIRLDQFKTRAFENAVGVTMTNYPERSMIGQVVAFNGQSIAFDAGGQLIVQAGRAEGVYLAPFDMAEMRKYRAETIWADAYRRPHRYEVLVNTSKSPVFERKNGFGNPFVATDR